MSVSAKCCMRSSSKRPPQKIKVSQKRYSNFEISPNRYTVRKKCPVNSKRSKYSDKKSFPVSKLRSGVEVSLSHSRCHCVPGAAG